MILKFAKYPPVASVCQRLRELQCSLYRSFVAYGSRWPKTLNEYFRKFAASSNALPHPGLRCSLLGSVKYCVNVRHLEFAIRDFYEFDDMCTVLEECRFNEPVYVALFCERELFISGSEKLKQAVSHLMIGVDCINAHMGFRMGFD